MHVIIISGVRSMPKDRIYLDTSVLGAIYDTEDPSRIENTEQLLARLSSDEGYESFISNILIEEIERAPSDIKDGLKEKIQEMNVEIIYESDECIELVEEYLRQEVIPLKYRDDARHIAVAVFNHIDYIITWNCKHMANIRNKRLINGINMMLGYPQIDIVTPMEVIGNE